MPEWTLEQKNAIEARGRRLLVSASAGSGKTAVLVERIIERILDKENPVSVDELLVMTFTKAATREMRSRIRQALIDNSRMDQVAILDSAGIQTIDSFCLNVVREHTDEIGIDPCVRIADESELTLIKSDVMEQMLEDFFEKSDDDFIDFAERYTSGNAGRGLDEIIYRMYKFSQSHPWPDEWLQGQLAEDVSDYKEYILRTLKPTIRHYIALMDIALSMCREESGPAPYEAAILREKEQLEFLEGSDTFDTFRKRLSVCEFGRIGTASKGKFDEELINKVKEIRDAQKKRVQSFMSLYLSPDSKDSIDTAVMLTREFTARMDAKKREKNVIDFSDAEHMALNLFTEHPEIAQDYKKRFREIYVDEYQDTSEVQEAIVNALDNGEVFMVGDVKQSIYKFRQARPEIFQEKYDSFAKYDPSLTGAEGYVINLDENFRSEPEVIETVNELFGEIMTGYQPMKTSKTRSIGSKTELLLAEIEEDDDKHSAEARLIAAKIADMKEKDPNLKFSDIVILLRSCNAVGDIYLNELLDAGIPAYCETNKGYFDSLEVRTMVSVLSAINNPYRDIDLVAMLHSPVIGMSDNELAGLIGRRRKGVYVYDRLLKSDNTKAGKAIDILNRFREMSTYLSIAQLVEKLYDESGYFDYVGALPAGKVRKANLAKLRRMGMSFAETGYKGLFNFLRYIDNLKTYDTDFGEASTLGENDDTVRIMSIHKSKGLQFPVVFVASLSHTINQLDTRKKIVMDSDLGIACEQVDLSVRVRRSTLKQNAIKLKMHTETIEEEMRILYVAMTRAQKQLLLVCDRESFEKSQETKRGTFEATSFADWVARLSYESDQRSDSLVSVFRNDSFAAVCPIKPRKQTLLTALRHPPENRHSDPSSDSDNSNLAQPDAADTGCHDSGSDETLTPDLRKMLYFEYPHQADVNLRNKISISELKKRWQEMQGVYETESQDAIAYTENEYAQPGIKESKEDSVSGGASRGTRYHVVMEKLDYADFEGFWNGLDEETKGIVKKSDIEAFIHSETGKLCSSAFAKGKLRRESQFIMGISAREVNEADSDELVLIQGIIDAYIDDDEIILIDYKTDRVNDEKDLVDKYAGQLNYYAIALEKLKGRKVSRKLIWSFTLGKLVEM